MGKRVKGTGNSKTAAVDVELEAVRERIERWRRTRTKRTAMSEELWDAAISLLEGRSVYAVARALNVSHDRLKMRALEAELEERSRASKSEADFVELRAGQVFGASEAAGSEVELLSADGARMTIRLEAGHAVDVVGLSDAFWSREQ